jgi:replicative DNA helicase
MLNTSKIPDSLKALPNWVLWKTGVHKEGDKPTKIPYDVRGGKAKANDSTTWAAFDTVLAKYDAGGFDGIGFEFPDNRSLCGVDLDGCRDPKTGIVSDWAKAIIKTLDTYAEVSPNQNGVKLFLRCKSALPTGRKTELTNQPVVCDKNPAIEIYDHARFFAVTGLRLAGPTEPQDRQYQINELCKRFFVQPGPVKEIDVMDRARRYIARIPGAVSGDGGHRITFRTACVLVCGFGLEPHKALRLLAEWNHTCKPMWSERELWHKVTDAEKQPGERNYLRFAGEAEWDAIKVPEYTAPKQQDQTSRVTTLFDATEQYLQRLTAGKIDLIELGLGSVDQALGGGVERGELVILAARPSHGKSAVALQVVHNWTKQNRPCVMVSEEMSAIALGKRTLQFASDTPQEYWFKSHRELQQDVADHFADRAPCYVIESCRTAKAAAEAIRKMVNDKQVQCAVVDYAQLLTGEGKSRYEQVTNTSICMRQLASELNIVVLLLCQLGSDVEKRPKGFRPVLSDIKDSGQFGQDADVIMFLCWPHRLDTKRDANEYQFFMSKNRNRGINTPIVQCKFMPSRQMFKDQEAKDKKNYDKSIDSWNERADVGAGSDSFQ